MPGDAEKALDLQILLGPFEEQFDLPAVYVDLCDGADNEMKVVVQEKILDTGCGFFEADTPQRDRALLGLGPCQFDVSDFSINSRKTDDWFDSPFSTNSCGISQE